MATQPDAGEVLQRLGVNVWPIHTVQFSNHTQYGKWEGLPTPNEQISLLVEGIGARGVLGSCDAVLTGAGWRKCFAPTRTEQRRCCS